MPVGRGFLVLDGTARKGRWIFRRLNGFNDEHPNSLKQDSGWNDYDWDRLQVNARDHAQQELAWRLPQKARDRPPRIAIHRTDEEPRGEPNESTR